MNTKGYWERIRRFCIVAVICSVALIGCGNAYETDACYREVRKKYSQVEVIGKYNFITKDENGDIHFVRTGNLTNAKISEDYLLFK